MSQSKEMERIQILIVATKHNTDDTSVIKPEFEMTVTFNFSCRKYRIVEWNNR